MSSGQTASALSGLHQCGHIRTSALNLVTGCKVLSGVGTQCVLVAWHCRLLSPSRIYKQIYDPIETKTELAAACQTLLTAEPQLPYQAAMQQLAHGVAVPQQATDPDVDYAHDGHEPERHQFQENDLLSHAAFVVQQLAPLFGRHAYKVCLPPT